jgi:hypothetical protein
MSSVFERLVDAQNAHDAVAMASCFAVDYRSAQPVHPGREFIGRDQVQTNWSSMFTGVPDFHVELVASARDGDVEWGEFDWQGHHTDGSIFAMRGVIVATVRHDLIAEARLYFEPVEAGDESIDEAVSQLSGPTSAGAG